MTSAKIMEKRDALRVERDQALREIGEELARGRQQMEDRARRARAQVWSEFKKKIADIK